MPVIGMTNWWQVMLVAVFSGAVVWLFSLRRQRRIESKAAHSLEQVTTLIDHADCILWESKVSLQRDRWVWKIKFHPTAYSRRFFGDCASTEQEKLWFEGQTLDREELDRRTREALEQKRPGYEQVFRLVRENRLYWMHENVSITPTASGEFWLVGLVTDITAQRGAEEARQHSERTVEKILAHADCLLWRATVTRAGDELKWGGFKMPRSNLYPQLFGETEPASDRLWSLVEVPDLLEMNKRSCAAIVGGAASYEHKFRTINRTGRRFWLNERVSIEQSTPDEWQVVGVITDITAQREAEEAQKSSERRLAHLLERTDSMLWQSQITRLPNGEIQWVQFFVPASPLYRRIFNREPGTIEGFSWREAGVPEELDMKTRYETAMAEGSSGYGQIFHVPKSTGDIWLSEQVSVIATGPNQWDLVGIITDITARRDAEAAQQASEGRLHELLTRADCLLWEGTAEFTADSWKWNFNIQPSMLCQQLYGSVQPPPNSGLWRGFNIPEWDEMNRRCRTAMTEGVPAYEQIFHIIKPDGSVLWIQESVTIKSLGAQRFSLVGVATDITAQRTAEIARRASEEQLGQLMGHANCMLWQADVTRDAANNYHWAWFVPKSELYRRIVGEDPNIKPIMPWGQLNVPEHEQLHLCSSQAMSQNLPGYEQKFRVLVGSEYLWMHEQVSIVPLGSDHWKLSGIVIDITENRRAEEARQASAAQLGKLLDVVDCMVWDAVVTPKEDGSLAWDHFMPRSALYRRIFGDTAEVRLLWHTKNVPELKEMDARAEAAIHSHASGYVNEFRVILPEGIIWLREDVTITYQPSGQLRMVGVVTDISARRVAEQSVRDSEQRYRTLFQHTPVAIIEADFTPVGRWLEQVRTEGVQDISAWFAADPTRVEKGASLVQLTNINETALTLFGAKTALALRRRRHLLETPDSLRVIRSAFIALWEGRNALEAELMMHDVQGGRRYMNMRWWIGRNETGIDLTQTVMVYIDLTELKKAEAALAGEKERLAVTLRAMTEGVITTDEIGRILFINPAASSLTQWDAETAIGRLISEVCIFQNIRDGATVEVPIARVAQGDVVINLPPQTRLVTPDGTHRIVEGCCAPIHSAASAVIGAVLVFRDVTEHERLEQELVRATRLESVGVLAGGIAHDFNNILTAVMGNIALGMLDVPADSPTGISLRAAEKASLRARDLTHQLLTFAKGGEPVREAVQLDSIVREMTIFALHGSQVKAVYDLAPRLWPADADKGQIGRVVQNLVINSMQAMPTGGTLRVSASNERVRGLTRPGLVPGDYILIVITDTGEGIPPENLARIFDPYFTTKKTGSGLGLAAVYSIIKKHRGHVEVESQIGQGTAFRIWLPALHEKAEQTATRPPISSTAMTGRVLFMDDDEIIRAMATKLLRRFGLDVVCAADGAEMVEKYRAASGEGRPFAIVVMDLTVPGGMGGLPALGKLKEFDPKVKAIVSSGYSSDPVLANYREHGFCAVISKPYDIHDFSRVLREALAGTKN